MCYYLNVHFQGQRVKHKLWRRTGSGGGTIPVFYTSVPDGQERLDSCPGHFRPGKEPPVLIG